LLFPSIGNVGGQLKNKKPGLNACVLTGLRTAAVFLGTEAIW